jgi:hypothetical protein
MLWGVPMAWVAVTKDVLDGIAKLTGNVDMVMT